MVVKRTGLSGTTIWRKVRDKEFPAPIHLTKHIRGWRESDIEAWINDRAEASR